MTKCGKRFCIIFINDKVYIDKYTMVCILRKQEMLSQKYKTEIKNQVGKLRALELIGNE